MFPGYMVINRYGPSLVKIMLQLVNDVMVELCGVRLGGLPVMVGA